MESSVIPKAYTHIYKEIESSQQESFLHSYNTTEKQLHDYEKLVNAIGKTLQVYSTPSPYWYFLYARIAFVSTRYDELDQFYENLNEDKKYIVAPFLGRIRAFQNKYEDAIELSQVTIEAIDLEEPTLLDVVLFFESYFTLGLSYAYTRQFDKANEIIELLEESSSKFQFKRLIGEDHVLDYVFIENIIKGYTMFFAGNPKEMGEVLTSMREWTPSLTDPWLEGFYFNIWGISRIMFQELAEGERALRVAFKKFEEVHDLRGYSTVGANLGISLITKGKRAEGREYLEAVISPMISMKNYWLAVGNMLELAKSYLEEKMEDKAYDTLQRAEKIATEQDIVDPNIYSMFSFFYSRVGQLNKSKVFLDKLEKIKEEATEDQYAELFYYMASAITSMHEGNLMQANADIVEGIEIADRADYFNYALELSMLHLEIILKRYLVEQKQEYILKALEVVNDVTPLITLTESPFYETLFYLLTAYLFLAVENYSDASENFDLAEQIALDSEETVQYQELSLYEQRRNFMTRAKPSTEVSNVLYDEFVNDWLSDEYLPIFYVMEAKRLLQNLQFEKTSLDQKTEDVSRPKLLFIVGAGGITIYSHRFDEDESLDEVLVGGFLSALTTFSQELFGGGMLTRIDQENHVVLMEKISEDNILVMIVDQETYSLRKNFKKFSSELARMKVVEYLNTDQVLTEFDPQFQIIEGIIEIVFGDNEDEAEVTQEDVKTEKLDSDGEGDLDSTEKMEEMNADDSSKSENSVDEEIKDTSSDTSIPEPVRSSKDEDEVMTPPGVGSEDIALTEASTDTSPSDDDLSTPEGNGSTDDSIDQIHGDGQTETESLENDSEDHKDEEEYVPSFMRYQSEDE